MRAIDLTQAAAVLGPLKQRAEASPIPYEMIKALAEGAPPPEDLYADFKVVVPGGVRVAFTNEVQVHGLMRHLSVSVEGGRTPDSCPHPVLIQEIMSLLGFINPLAECKSWIEDTGTEFAINILEPEDGDWTPYLK